MEVHAFVTGGELSVFCRFVVGGHLEGVEHLNHVTQAETDHQSGEHEPEPVDSDGDVGDDRGYLVAQVPVLLQVDVVCSSLEDQGIEGSPPTEEVVPL